jgi:hypothetical protein
MPAFNLSSTTREGVAPPAEVVGENDPALCEARP